jgi:hypothetical protein
MKGNDNEWSVDLLSVRLTEFIFCTYMIHESLKDDMYTINCRHPTSLLKELHYNCDFIRVVPLN